MTNPLFSIIIPTYNSSNTLIRCLESIILQNFSNYEVWFIDGYSHDNTISIIKEYATKYPFIHLVSEPDKGIYDAMNKGIGLAQGKWLYFLGSDDTFYNKDVLTRIAKEINITKSKVIYGNVIMRGESKWNLDGVVFAGEYNLERLLNMTICHQAMFYNKEVFEKYGNYDLKYNVGADWEFNLRCFAHTSFSYFNIIVANFFLGGHSTTSTDSQFSKNQGAIYLEHFKHRIYQKSFINSRLYLRQAALSFNSPLNIEERLLCLAAYIKLKVQAILFV